MIFTIRGFSEKGFVREDNEDAILSNESIGLFAVADGVGGLPNGKLASKTAVDSLEMVLKKNPQCQPKEAMHQVNEMCRKIGYKRYFFGFATTLTFVHWIEEKGLFAIGHIGDSTAVHVRKDQVNILTTEHTVATRITEETPQGHAPVIRPKDHHTLTQCIGQEAEIKPQIIEVPFISGDRLFLFTDGVTKAVDEDHLSSFLQLPLPIDNILEEISNAVDKAGAPDNYSMIAIDSQ